MNKGEETLDTRVAPLDAGAVGRDLPHRSQSGEVTAVAPEICICAAIKLVDGRIIRGHRHDDCIQTAIKWQADPKHAIQGFMTSRNRFVDRYDGMAIQNAAGIESITGYRGDVLFSEDLY